MTKIALITGASRGLGAALAEQLAATHHIVAVAKTVGALEELDDRIQASGGAATLAPMDITKPDAMAQLCRGIYDRWGHVDLWAHTAIHAAPLAPANHIDAKDLVKSMDINVTATATLIQMVAPLLDAAPLIKYCIKANAIKVITAPPITAVDVLNMGFLGNSSVCISRSKLTYYVVSEL